MTIKGINKWPSGTPKTSFNVSIRGGI